ncbi:MAG: hypothetical protein E7551_09060 [Ruminococcaceae bacterium]|nr:hypothetical protein [Oscillospiraceae bacterium]
MLKTQKENNMSFKKNFFQQYFLQRKNLILFSFFSILSAFVMAIIFAFSHQTADASASLSNGLSNIILDIFEFVDSSKKELYFAILKIFIRDFAHLFLFTLLGNFLTCAVINLNVQKSRVKYLFVLLIGLAYSVADETHQFFVEGRSCQIYDVILDFSGVLLGVIFAMIFYKIFQIIAKKRKIS